MHYRYIDPLRPPTERLGMPKGQVIAGYAIGILHLDVWYPLLPGNVVNATTYDFPVRYKQIEGGTQDRIHGADPTVVDAIVAAGRELQREGVRAIAGACGYLGNFQNPVAAALEIPVYLSSLLQVPMIQRGLGPKRRIGVLCADGPAVTPQLLAACGIPADNNLVILGLENQAEFSSITFSKGEFDMKKIQDEVVAAAVRLAREHSDLGAILLECSDMPPFAWAVQQAVQLPVFDFITMINWAYHSVTQRSYAGII